MLPNRLTADILEQLRISKQTLVELGSKAGALKQMLFDILEDSHEIRRLCIVGRNCILSRNDDLECSVPQEKQIAEGMCDIIFESYCANCLTDCCMQKKRKKSRCYWKTISKDVNHVIIKRKGFLSQQEKWKILSL